MAKRISILDGQLGARLKLLREKRGLTARQLADQIGVPVSTYREWEYGRAIVGEPYVAMSKALDVGVHELLTGESPSRTSYIAKIEKITTALFELKALLLNED